MIRSTKRCGLWLIALAAVMPLWGCSQFGSAEVPVATQALNNPFDVAVDAARKGDLEHIRKCVESDARYVDAYDGTGRTLLHYAAQRGDRDLVSYLIQQGSFVLAEDEEGYTPLDVAVQSLAPQSVIDLLRDTTIKESTAY